MIKNYKETYTVDTLKKFLDVLSDLWYGNMPILFGNNAPLLNGSISINYIDKKLLILNTYYDKQLVDAATKLKDSIDKNIKVYLTDCYHAGIDIKEDVDE